MPKTAEKRCFQARWANFFAGKLGVLHYTSSVPHSGVTVGGRLVACYGCGHCVNYMPKGSDRWPSSDANLDVIADNRGERPGKTPNWDAPKQRLELLLRT